MTVAASLVVEISGRDVNLAALLQRVQAQLQQANTAGTRTAGVLGGPLTTSQERAANSALALAAAYSRLALAEGDPARAASILRTALDANGAASERLQVSLQATATRLETGRTAFQQFGDAAKGSLLSIVGPAALVATAMGAATKIVASFGEAFKFKAELDATRTAIEAQLHGVRDSGQAFSQAAVFADRYKLTQQEVTQALQASVGIMRQSKSSVEDILGTLARLRVASPEQSLEGAALALKELAGGDITSLVGRFEISRTAANKMKEEIKGGADAVQVLSKYLDSAGISMGTLESQTTGAMGAMRDYARATEDLKLAQADFAQGPGVAFLGAATAYLHEFTNVARGELSPVLRDAGAAMGALQAQAIGTAASFIQTGDAAHATDAGLISMALAFLRATGQIDQASGAVAANTSATSTNAGAINLQSQAMIDAANATETNAQAIATQTDASVQQIEKTQASTVASNALAQMQALLSQLAGQVAGGLISDSQAAIVLANGYGIAYGKALQLIDAQAALARVSAAAEHQKFVAENRDDLRGSRVNAQAAKPLSADFLADQKRRTDDLRESELALARAQGSRARELALLNQQQAQYAKGSAEWNKVEAQKLSLEKSGARSGGARGGAVKLSDQTKLNNSLLAQQEKADSQAEDAALKHEKRIQDIEQAAYEKRLAASRKYNQDRLDGEASFYEQLGSVGSSGNAKADADLKKNLSARYEAAALKADEIARTRGADAGDAFLEASAAAIAKEGELQDKINKAKQEKNAGEAEYLTGVLALQKKADDARLAQIEAQGSQIEAERQKQLADEDAAYQEQTGRIETAAQRKADATVQAEIRSGKAIDVTNLKLKEQEDRLNRIGQAAGGGAPATSTPTQGTGSPTAPVPAVAPAVGAGGDMAAVVTALQAAQAAIVDALGRVERAEQGTTGAVRGLRTAGGLAG